MELSVFETRERWVVCEANPFKMLALAGKLKAEGTTVLHWYTAPEVMHNLVQQLALATLLGGFVAREPPRWELGGADLRVDHEGRYAPDRITAIIAEGTYNIQPEAPWED